MKMLGGAYISLAALGDAETAKAERTHSTAGIIGGQFYA